MAVYINTLNGGNITIGSSGSSGHADTRFTLEGGTVETYDISGTLDVQWMNDNGYWDGDVDSWAKNITQVDIGNTVTSIGDFTFSNCIGLTSVTISGGVTSIGEGAFYYCDGLKSVTIPDGVTSIGPHAFYGCNLLKNVTIVATGKPGASAASVKDMMISAGVDSSITWNMPS
jgi:hypothetical protein